MTFSIDYPNGMIEPNGLHLAHFKDIQQAVVLTKIALDHFPNTDFEEDFKFTIMVTDEVLLFNGKLAFCRDAGEGIILHPSSSKWTVEGIFEMILYGLFGSESEE